MESVEDMREPELKRPRYGEREGIDMNFPSFHATSQRHVLDGGFAVENGDLPIPSMIDRMKASSYRYGPSPTGTVDLGSPNVSQPTDADSESSHPSHPPKGIDSSYVGQEDLIDSLRMTNAHLKKENDKKEFLIQDLLRKLHDSLETIRVQAQQIKELQLLVSGVQSPLEPRPPPPEEKVFKVPAPVNRPPKGPSSENGHLELRVLQQPPSQAVYQRILRPFPTVSVVGFNSSTMCNNLFVEVNLLTQTDNDPQGAYQNLFKVGNQVDIDKKNLMLGGQRVQRSELGSSPDTLVVVFRKLKILTTTAQQGGAFFLLQFVLKRYIDNSFETVEGVSSVISDPIEVFSHTLYLKGRPAPAPAASPTLTQPKGKRGKDKSATKSIVSQTNSALVNANVRQLLQSRVDAAEMESIAQGTPNVSNIFAARDLFSVRDGLSSLVAASEAVEPVQELR